jgi:hypothetical protein
VNQTGWWWDDCLVVQSTISNTRLGFCEEAIMVRTPAAVAISAAMSLVSIPTVPKLDRYSRNKFGEQVKSSSTTKKRKRKGTGQTIGPNMRNRIDELSVSVPINSLRYTRK